MNTFVPYPDIEESLRCLDNQRLGKQRVEARQILSVLDGQPSRWASHPAVLMWKGSEETLRLYLRRSIEEWTRRGFKNSMTIPGVETPVIWPWWWDTALVHQSHQANLMRKNSHYYGKYRWPVNTKMPYVWPQLVDGKPYFKLTVQKVGRKHVSLYLSPADLKQMDASDLVSWSRNIQHHSALEAFQKVFGVSRHDHHWEILA